MKPDADMVRELTELYNKTGKHSNYQILPERLKNLINQDDLQVKSRYERERLEYITKYVDFKDAEVADIGGNTGYFTFEALDLGASYVKYYEGNKNQASFVSRAAVLTGLDDKLDVHAAYVDFETFDNKSDIMFLLNVLHHVGDDFGDPSLSMTEAKKLILRYLNRMAEMTTTIIFQMGFCWKGNINHILFEHGTKAEMIEFIEQGTASHWEMVRIGIAERNGETVEFRDLNDGNIARDDSLGEFLNRPIFVMRAKK
ncbi:MAG: hypothetical protein Kow00108_26590 [Calditrichia bacterium]